MTKDLEIKLVKEYPHLLEDYGEKGGSLTGIWCDDGWYDLVEKFCAQADLLGYEFNCYIRIKQIKEKFGLLRIYFDCQYDSGSERNDLLVKEILDACAMKAETLSANTCEITGKYGTLCQFRNRYKTLSYEAVSSSVKYRNFQPVSNSIAEYWQELERKKADE